MIVEYIRYTIAVDRRSAFESAYGQAGAALQASPECHAYELSRCVEEANEYILRIEWDSLAAHMQGFRRSPQFRTFFASIQPYVGDINEMRHYEITPIQGRA